MEKQQRRRGKHQGTRKWERLIRNIMGGGKIIEISPIPVGKQEWRRKG